MLNLRRKILCLIFYFLEFFSLKSRFVYCFYLKWIGKIFIDEFHMAQVTNHDLVLHIGCGSLPTMSILSAQQAHAKVVAIDNDPKAVQRAHRYIAKHQLSDAITVMQGDAETYPVDAFDVIFIAINVSPIDVVFRHLATHAKPQVRIICRDLGTGLIHMLQNEEFSGDFKIQNQLRHEKTYSLLITK
jgi:ribosomal protein L11 methylase PrmA